MTRRLVAMCAAADRPGPKTRRSSVTDWTSTQMRCVRCGHWWEVLEAGWHWLDPARYVCPDDRRPKAGQLGMDENVRRVDRPDYDPDLAAIPF